MRSLKQKRWLVHFKQPFMGVETLLQARLLSQMKTNQQIKKQIRTFI